MALTHDERSFMNELARKCESESNNFIKAAEVKELLRLANSLDEQNVDLVNHYNECQLNHCN